MSGQTYKSYLQRIKSACWRESSVRTPSNARHQRHQFIFIVKRLSTSIHLLFWFIFQHLLLGVDLEVIDSPLSHSRRASNPNLWIPRHTQCSVASIQMLKAQSCVNSTSLSTASLHNQYTARRKGAYWSYDHLPAIKSFDWILPSRVLLQPARTRLINIIRGSNGIILRSQSINFPIKPQLLVLGCLHPDCFWKCWLCSCICMRVLRKQRPESSTYGVFPKCEIAESIPER